MQPGNGTTSISMTESTTMSVTETVTVAMTAALAKRQGAPAASRNVHFFQTRFKHLDMCLSKTQSFLGIEK